MNDISHNLALLKKRIADACHQSNRNPQDVKLLLATKTVSAEKIKMALEAGENLIGENKVQELRDKYDGLQDISHQKHFIGHLQSNKIKDIIKYDVSCLESLDRLKLAEKLHQRLIKEDKKMEVLIQVNTSAEESKFGVRPEDTLELVQQVAQFPTLQIKGLMTIGLFSSETEKVRRCFQLLQKLQTEIKQQNIPNVKMNELSMGMSNDLETAIEEGATIVRVGTAIFGERVHPDSYYWNEESEVK